MIKLSELRIGNYVQTGDSVGRVKTINYSFFQVDDERCMSLGCSLRVDFKPIIVTKEWLDKFGFEAVGDHVRYIRAQNECYIFFNFNEGTCGIAIENTDEATEESIYLDIDYVHNLQNIYHALSGEEFEPDNMKLG